ncbi:MAG: GNAT family N-acetyltransferase [Myxococcota bacterium]
MPKLVFHEVDEKRWPDFERLFEARGGPKYCWCMAWRATSAEAREGDSTSRKSAMRRRVRAGTPVGILGYLDGEPVAWCSVAPRETYRKLGGPDHGEVPGEVWSVVCFYVVKALRGEGLIHRLLDAAVATARKHGAKVVEAYPVDPESPSYRFMGFVGTFEAAGFTEVGRAGTRRHVMRLPLEKRSR